MLAGPLNNVRGALKLYEELTVLYPEDVSVLRKRLDLQLASSPPDGAGAATTIQQLAKLGALDVDGLRFLLEWYVQQNQPDSALVMATLLALCGEATAEEQREVKRSRADFNAMQMVAHLNASILDQYIRYDHAPSLVVDSLAAAAVALGQKEEGPPGPSHHLEEEFKHLTATLGQPKSRLVWGQIGFGTTVVNSTIPTVMTDPNDFNGLSGKEQRFEMARLAFLCQPEAIMTAVLDEFDYVTFHEAALRPIRKAEDDLDSDDSLKATIEQWWSAFGWSPEQFPIQAPPQAELGREDIPSPVAWRQHVTHTAWRLGLLYCDQLEDAIGQLVRRHPALSGRSLRTIADIQAAMNASEEIRCLIAYALSDQYLAARRALGLARDEFDTSADASEDAEPDTLDEKGVTEFELEIEEGSVDAMSDGESEREV